MKRIKTSIVAWSGAGALASFAILYQFVPYDRMLDLALSLAFGVSLAAVVRYLPDAARAFVSGRGGAAFLIVAVFSMVLTILMQRTWGIVLRIYDRPDWLVMSPMAIFVPWMLSWAVSLALVAPDIEDDGVRVGSGIWKSVALFISGAMAGFVLATSFQAASGVEVSLKQAWPHLANRPSCPPDQDVWGSSRGVYHTMESPYRALVIPRHCFATAEDAESKGFRKAKGIESDAQ